MTQFARILAAVDSSEPARDAFDYALALSKHHGAELVVVQAISAHQLVRSEARERLALTAQLQRRAAQANVEFTYRVQQGDAAETILSYARSLEPDMIVMGTHQPRGLDRFRMRSVAERVTARATVPVLLIPALREATPFRPFRHMAVAVEFDAGSRRTLEHALALATDAGDRITMLHVVPGSAAPDTSDIYSVGIVESQNQMLHDGQRRVMRDALRRLHEAVPVARKTSAPIDVRVLMGDTATEIIRAVDSMDADVLVVGVPRRNAISRALFGTTAARLRRVVGIPMLAVPDVSSVSMHWESTAKPLAA